jgi:hypothetical protein
MLDKRDKKITNEGKQHSVGIIKQKPPPMGVFKWIWWDSNPRLLQCIDKQVGEKGGKGVYYV